MIAVFFGSRTWWDLAPIEAAMDRLLEEAGGDLTIVTGANGCRGTAVEDECPLASADALADWAARWRGWDPVRVHAAWEIHDRAGPVPCRCSNGKRVCKAAGIRRNQTIIDDHLAPALARGETVEARGFRMPGVSPGTDDMVARLKTAGIHGTIKRAGPDTWPPPGPRRRLSERPVYVDPPACPTLLAHIPEQHVSPRCERALRGGHQATYDPAHVACEMCMPHHGGVG